MKKTKREKEKEIVSLMIGLYCRKNHKDRRNSDVRAETSAEDSLCEECRQLKEYAWSRVDHCPFMESKTFCSSCRVHCYKPQMREKIREVMRFSGPRMILYHPLLAVRHVISSAGEKRRTVNNPGRDRAEKKMEGQQR